MSGSSCAASCILQKHGGIREMKYKTMQLSDSYCNLPEQSYQRRLEGTQKPGMAKLELLALALTASGNCRFC